MRRLLFIIALTLLFLPIYGQSRLKTGQWIKIEIKQSGIHCLTYSQLRKWGLNPEKTHIYGYGGAMLSQDFSQPAIEDLPQVGCIRLSDRILFYAQGSFSWAYTGGHFRHTRNPYSDQGYYFISDIETSEPDLTYAPIIDSDQATDINTFIDYKVHEEDKVNLVDINGIEGGGREWFGEQVTNAKAVNLTMPFAHIVGSLYGYAMVAGVSKQWSTFQLKVGSSSRYITTEAIYDNYTRATTAFSIGEYEPIGTEEQPIVLSYSCSDANGVGYLNYIELEAECELRMQGNEMTFRHPANYLDATPIRYHLKGADSHTIVLDITDLSHIVAMPTITNGDELIFTATNEDQVHEFIAVNTSGSNWLEPEKKSDIDNQDLHQLEGIQYVIICPKDFVPMATQLAKAHEGDPYWKEEQSITWAVVTDEQVYNEFSSGTPDATAYRRFMKMLYDKAKNNTSLLAPKWLLLMGDGTYDNRKLSSLSGPNTLLTYQAANSINETFAISNDGYFGCLEDEKYIIDARLTMQIGVGRLPVSTKEEAQAVVNKIEDYIYDQSPMSWRREILFMADNYDTYPHIQGADEPARIVEKYVPGYTMHKIYLDVYPKQVTSTAESCPIAKTQLDNLLQSGVMMLNYSGHGGYNAITSEAMMNINSISTMTNPHLALWFFATCSFAHYDAGKRSAAEEAVLNPNGGAIGVISACRTVYASQNKDLNTYFCQELFEHSDDYHFDVTIGEALYKAKNKLINDANRLAYHLLGDPAIRLHYPDNITIHTTDRKDTIRSLEVNEVKGVVRGPNDDTLKQFNGVVDIYVYDKKQTITTPPLGKSGGTYQYTDYPNIIFHGKTSVEDGCFQYAFMTPKDIRYNFDYGRIAYYAYDEQEGLEGVGYDNDLVVGGTGSILIQDTQGPDINMYIENAYRDSTQATYASPRFYASLFDSCGINTVGSGIGHDLILMVDNSNVMTYNLNAYFEADKGSYQSGSISYRLPPLGDGQHAIQFKAWDLMNNSSTQTLSFTVNQNIGPTLYKIIAYPNPVSISGLLTLHLEHDQEDEVLQTQINIFDLAGRRLYSAQQSDAYDIVIPMNEVAISTGVYIYKVIIKSPTNGSSTLAGKILVVH